jgi:hypothetical protein
VIERLCGGPDGPPRFIFAIAGQHDPPLQPGMTVGA